MTELRISNNEHLKRYFVFPPPQTHYTESGQCPRPFPDENSKLLKMTIFRKKTKGLACLFISSKKFLVESTLTIYPTFFSTIFGMDWRCKSVKKSGRKPSEMIFVGKWRNPEFRRSWYMMHGHDAWVVFIPRHRNLVPQTHHTESGQCPRPFPDEKSKLWKMTIFRKTTKGLACLFISSKNFFTESMLTMVPTFLSTIVWMDPNC